MLRVLACDGFMLHSATVLNQAEEMSLPCCEVELTGIGSFLYMQVFFVNRLYIFFCSCTVFPQCAKSQTCSLMQKFSLCKGRLDNHSTPFWPGNL